MWVSHRISPIVIGCAQLRRCCEVYFAATSDASVCLCSSVEFTAFLSLFVSVRPFVDSLAVPGNFRALPRRSVTTFVMNLVSSRRRELSWGRVLVSQVVALWCHGRVVHPVQWFLRWLLTQVLSNWWNLSVDSCDEQSPISCLVLRLESEFVSVWIYVAKRILSWILSLSRDFEDEIVLVTYGLAVLTTHSH